MMMMMKMIASFGSVVDTSPVVALPLIGHMSFQICQCILSRTTKCLPYILAYLAHILVCLRHKYYVSILSTNGD